jgi:hypothetical protein
VNPHADVRSKRVFSRLSEDARARRAGTDADAGNLRQPLNASFFTVAWIAGRKAPARGCDRGFPCHGHDRGRLMPATTAVARVASDEGAMRMQCVAVKH